MADLNAWLGSSAPLSDWTDTTDRAYDTARRIDEQAASIVVQRRGGNLAAQTVRIDLDESTPRETSSGNVSASNQRVLITGYADHPDIDDTLLRRGDRFFFDGDMYTVTQVVKQTGRLLASAEVGE